MEPLENCLICRVESVRLAAAHCLKSLVLAQPAVFPRLAPILFQAVQRDSLALLKGSSGTNGGSSGGGKNAATSANAPTAVNDDDVCAYLGRCVGLAAVLAAMPVRPLYLSFDLVLGIYAWCGNFINNSNSTNSTGYFVCQRGAWLLVAALMGPGSAGAAFLRLHATQLMLHFGAAFPRLGNSSSNGGANNNTSPTLNFSSQEEWLAWTEAKLAALTALLQLLARACDTSSHKEINAAEFQSLLNAVHSTDDNSGNSYSVGGYASPVTPGNNKNTTGDLSEGRQGFSVSAEMASRVARVLENALHTWQSHVPTWLSNSTSNSSNSSSSTTIRFKTRLWQCFGALAKSQGNSVGSFVASHASLLNAVAGAFSHITDEALPATTLLPMLMHPDDTSLLGEASYADSTYTFDGFSEIHSGSSSDLSNVYDVEYDVVALLLQGPLLLAAPPTLTAHVNASIFLFGALLAAQPHTLQESAFDGLKALLKGKISTKIRAAVERNTLVAIFTFLQALADHDSHRATNANNSTTATTSQKTFDLCLELCLPGLVGGDATVRCAAAETLALLASTMDVRIPGTARTLVQTLVDQVIHGRDPGAKAGFGFALACLFRKLGGLAFGAHLATIGGMLASLAMDPDTQVQAWALHALCITQDSAGPAFSALRQSIDTLVTRTALSDAHDHAGAGGQRGRLLHGMAGVLGPELAMEPTTLSRFLDHVEALLREPDTEAVAQGLRCLQQLLLLAPKSLKPEVLLPRLQIQLMAGGVPIRRTALTCVRQLTQRDPPAILYLAARTFSRNANSSCTPGLQDQLLAIYDDDVSSNSIAPRPDSLAAEAAESLYALLRGTAAQHPGVWINLAQDCLGRAAGTPASLAASPVHAAARTDTEDESVGGGRAPAGASGAAEEETGPGLLLNVYLAARKSKTPHWRTQVLCLQLLCQVIATGDNASGGGGANSANSTASASSPKQPHPVLISRLPDLIKLAFNAATSSADALKLQGLVLLRHILEGFAWLRDPDYEGHSLLEQYQAQLGTALTPCFAPDVIPEVRAAGARVCAVYVASGISEELVTLGRPIKLLVAELQSVLEGEASGSGSDDREDDADKNASDKNSADNNILSPETRTMLRLATLAAWASLVRASATQQHLESVVAPHTRSLLDAWLATLRTWSAIQCDTEHQLNGISLAGTGIGTNTTIGGEVQSMYSVAASHVLVPHYEAAGTALLQAIAALIDTGNTHALHLFSLPTASDEPDRDTNTKAKGKLKVVTSASPHGYYTLFGICVDRLAASLDPSPAALTALAPVLHSLFSPDLLKASFNHPRIVTELWKVLDRLVQAGSTEAQAIVMRMLADMCNLHAERILSL